MTSPLLRIALLSSLLLSPIAAAHGDDAHVDDAHVRKALSEDKPQAAVCEHGVRATLCTRCKPKRAAVFKAKGDWCAEHDRPESQCALCHPALKKQGVKE